MPAGRCPAPFAPPIPEVHALGGRDAARAPSQPTGRQDAHHHPLNVQLVALDVGRTAAWAKGVGHQGAGREPVDTLPLPCSGDDRGYIWVSATVAEGEARRFDVVDPEGRYLGGLEAGVLPERVGIPVIRGDRLYLVLSDDLDVQYVASYRIEGRGVR